MQRQQEHDTDTSGCLTRDAGCLTLDTELVILLNSLDTERYCTSEYYSKFRPLQRVEPGKYHYHENHLKKQTKIFF